MLNRRILVALTDPNIRNTVANRLIEANLKVDTVENSDQILDHLVATIPEMLITQVNFPQTNAVELHRWIKQHPNTKDIPILILTENINEEDIALALDSGIDDFLHWPVGKKLLIAKIRSIFKHPRRNIRPVEKFLQINDIRINIQKRFVEIKKQKIDLTFSEFQILHLLMKKPGWVFTREKIVESIRGNNHAITDRAIDVQIVGLRKKLKGHGDLIETVRGVGYRFSDN